MVDESEHTPPPIPKLTRMWKDWEEFDRAGKPDRPWVGVTNNAGDATSQGNPTTLLGLKLAVFKDVIIFCSADHSPEKLTEILSDLQNPRVEQFALDHRLKRALEGKEAANKKYKAGDQLGAMYTYAVAWSLILPYHPNADGVSEELRRQIVKVETALFSNISAVALMQIKDHTPESSHSTPSRPNSGALSPTALESLAQIGLDASEVCISFPGEITVGIMVKSCRRARELCEKITQRQIPKDKIRFFEQQEELLKGLDEKGKFADVPKSKIARPVLV